MIDPYKMVFVNVVGIFLLLSIALFYRFIYPKKKINLFVLLLLISILPIISIFRPGTYESGDLTLHSVFLQSFYENLKDSILIPQWAGGLCGGYGCPVFLFEYTMPFYLSSVFHFLGFSYLNSIKLFLATAYILSGISMYFFIKEGYGSKSAFIGSLLYLFSPVRFIEMHFRVSIGTDASFIFIPLVFLFAKKSLSGNPIYIILGAINILLLILSHSSVAFIIVPLSLVYVFIQKKQIKKLIYPIFSLILGIGLSSFYILPALFEVNYTWYSQTIKNVSEFYPISYYLYSPTRLGLLFQGNNGELRLIVGYAELLIVLFAIYGLIKNLFKQTERILIIFLVLTILICFSLMLSFTKPLWNNVFFLRSFVLPWRMLVPISFAIAYLGAIITKNWKNFIFVVFCILIIGTTILNWGNRKMVALDPNAYYKHWSLYTEYFEPNNPIYLARYNNRVGEIPNLVLHRPSSPLQIISGIAKIKQTNRTQIDHEYIVHADTNLQLSENTYYFPGWNVYINGKKTNINIQNRNSFGTMTFSLPKGLYLVEAKFEDTNVRFIGKVISIILLALILIFLLAKTIPYLTFHNLKYKLTKLFHV